MSEGRNNHHPHTLEGGNEKKKRRRREYLRQWRLANPETIARSRRRGRKRNRERSKERYRANREVILEEQRTWRLANRDRLNAKRREWYRQNHDTVLPRKRKAHTRWRRRNRDHVRRKSREHYRANREALQRRDKQLRDAVREGVLFHYSSGAMACLCCGEKHSEFLTLDHIRGKRNYPEELRCSGFTLYERLKARGFPEGFRVLCLNCNGSMGFRGYCPHGVLPPVARKTGGRPTRD